MKLPRHRSLGLAISLALVVKIVLLYLLWHFFFSHPLARKMRMPTAQVESHLLTVPAPTTPTQEVNDGPRR